MNRPVKKVENHTYNLKYGTIGSVSIRNSGDAHDRHKISTFLAGVIPDTQSDTQSDTRTDTKSNP